MHNHHEETRCHRRGCNRNRRGKNLERLFCSGHCAAVARFVAESEHALAVLGVSDVVDEYWASARELSNALDRVQRARGTLRRLSLEADWTSEQFDALLRGDYTAPGVTTTEQVAG